MEKIEGITVMTTTYNRVSLLERLYQNLTKESMDWKIQWLVADDGSTDETEMFLNDIAKRNTEKLTVEFIRLNQGGKHRALNKLQALIKWPVVTVIDDDDVLMDGALHELKLRWAEWYGKVDEISYLRGNIETHKAVVEFPDVFYEGNVFDYRYRRELKGDYFETYTTSLFTSNEFPEFENENFMDEGIKWQELAKNSRGLFLNKVLYLSEYRQDGLTKKIRSIQVRNSNGFAMFQLRKAMTERLGFMKRLRSLFLFKAFKNIKKNYLFDESNLNFLFRTLNVLLTLPSELLALYLRLKFFR